MNLSIQGLANNKDARLNSSNKVTTLNPNAAEFVPSTLRSPFGGGKSLGAEKLDVPGPSKSVAFDRSESTLSSNSDDEAYQYWRHQLPDDITPDFKVMGEELHGPGNLSLSGLSIHDSVGTSRSLPSAASQTLGMRQDMYSFTSNNSSLSEKMRYYGSTFGKEQSVSTIIPSANTWGKPLINGVQHATNGRELHRYVGDSTTGLVNNLIGDNAVTEDGAINPIEFLSSQFPDFAAQNLADAYYRNGCDLNSTIEILSQLELQVDGGFPQNLNSKSLAAPSPSKLEFPALPVTNAQNGLGKYSGEDIQQVANTFRSPSGTFRVDADFASAVRELASQDYGNWRNERNGSADGGVGSSRSSQLLASLNNGHGKMVYGEKLQNYGTARTAPVWRETGGAVANMYSEAREEAHDVTRVRNAFLEQARQAYLIGNKALAKELSLKGQLYNMQMKAAHEKARETIYRQRNLLSPELQGYNRGQEQLIDLHGLHVNEAIHVLNHELGYLRSSARSSGQQLQVMISVGTGHHTKGSRTPARLPVAVEQYLIEEGLPYTQPQPGLLRVVIY